jgi:hypothetical protein
MVVSTWTASGVAARYTSEHGVPIVATTPHTLRAATTDGGCAGGEDGGGSAGGGKGAGESGGDEGGDEGCGDEGSGGGAGQRRPEEAGMKDGKMARYAGELRVASSLSIELHAV